MSEIEFMISKAHKDGLWHVKHIASGLICQQDLSRAVAEDVQYKLNNRVFFPNWDVIRQWPINQQEG